MTAKEKAWDLMHKTNGITIKTREWQMCSDYARSDLKRKALIIVDEVIKIVDAVDDISNQFWKDESGNYKSSEKHLDYWYEVKSEIEKL